MAGGGGQRREDYFKYHPRRLAIKMRLLFMVKCHEAPSTIFRLIAEFVKVEYSVEDRGCCVPEVE